ncbi:hypothetical protein [Flavobacterium johnsoniae]|uniref:hypothetical protein n=1 Tax=Flavobacterium johnsoniae TaxID=986 RepID=UPI0005C44653|nr:hypothetical protein [Flavobacterium johnsoniae]OXE96171.1 hypothetical protein B0A63_21900 [Flavobacterium johnsoniae UW101]WQG79174.1 hypothetical protein SR927_14220 [Flavobacterium johnsoniae UW101]SHK07973.1 hypothetical protein SAMN05444146_0329 [Flavobacterium johnsoniae]
MKNKLISLLQKLLMETNHIDMIGIKVSILESKAFLANPRTIGEIRNILDNVNAYIELPNDANKIKIES